MDFFLIIGFKALKRRGLALNQHQTKNLQIEGIKVLNLDQIFIN